MIRVAIVDDHAIVRTGLTQLIDTTDDLVLSGSYPDGESAVEAIVLDPPDVVLMDLSMPGIGGIETTRRLTDVAPDAAVVVLTSMADDANILAALDAGAIGYVLKHADPDELLDAVRSAASGGSPLDPKVARVLLDANRTKPTASAALSERELDVLRLVAEGKANKTIARELGIAERTVKAHLTNIFGRIGVTDRTQAALWATQNLPPT